MSFDKEQARIAIVGAGIAGILTAIALKRQLGFENFVLYEKAPDIGGTWRDNTYPGCGSDVAGHWYSLSTDLNPNWSSFYVTQPEIKAYWTDLVRKYNLASHIVHNTRVAGAIWDNHAQVYRLTLADSVSGEEREEAAEVLVSAIGGFMNPSYPKDVVGREAFRGETFHSARWRHDVELKGKRVGVIGNGCSAAQFVPQISKDPTVEIINFCRTPSWFVPRGNFTYPSWLKWAFANVPLLMRSYRNLLAIRYDLGVLPFRNANKRIQNVVRKELTKHIKYAAPADQVERLTPSYPPGCKRMIVDAGYLESLKRPNVTMNWDGIDSIVAEGIKTKNSELVPLDVIIFGTGFEMTGGFINLRGNDGMSITDYFDSQGGPTAYLGTTIPGFPNFFMLMGPNTATGHASIIFTEESQINYALQMIKPIIDRTARSFEVRSGASEAYNLEIQRRIAGSVFTACASWYQLNARGKNFAIFPGPLVLYWWWMRTPRWEHYRAVGAERWEAARRRRRLVRRAALGLLGLLVVAFWKTRRVDAVLMVDWLKKVGCLPW